MAIKSNTDSVTISVELNYNEQQAQKIARQVAGFQRSQEQSTARHKQKLAQQAEVAAQRLAQLEDKFNKQAELRQKASQARMLSGTKTWSEKMVSNINSIRTTILALAAAFVSTQIIGGIKQLATEALSLASDINTLAKATGLSVEELSKLRGVALVTGVEFTTLQASFGAITSKLEDARRGSVDAQRAFRALNIDFNADGLNDVIEKLYNAAQNTDNLGKISKIAGNEAATAFAKMGTYANSFDEAMANAQDQFGALDTKGSEALNSLSDKIAQIRLKTQFSITNALGAAAPQLEKALERLTESLNGIDWDKIVSGAINFADVAGFLAFKVMPPLVTVFRSFNKVFLIVLGAGTGLLKLVDITFNKTMSSFMKASINATRVAKEMQASIQVASRTMQDVINAAAAIKAAIIKSDKLEKLVNTLTKLARPLRAIQNVARGIFKWLGRIAIVGWIIDAVIAMFDFNRALTAGLGVMKSLGIATKNWVDDLFFGLIGWRKENAKLLKDAEKASNKSNNLFPMTSVFGGENRAKMYDTLDPYTAKLKELLESQAEANKEFVHWTNLLSNGKIPLKTYLELVSGLKDSLSDKNLAKLNLLTNKPDFSPLSANARIPKQGQQKPFSIDDSREYTGIIRQIAEESQAAKKQIIEATKAYEYFVSIGDKASAKIAASLANIEKLDFLGMANKILGSLSTISGGLLSVYDSLIQAEQYRLEAARAANEERVSALTDEINLLNRLGFGNTQWAKRKEAEAAAAEKQDSARMRRLQKERQKYAVVDATINSLASFTTNLFAYKWPLGAILGGLSVAAGLAQVSAIRAQEFATGGMVQGNPYQDNNQVFTQGGEYVVNRQATARNAALLESINNGVNPGGAGSVVVNINGNVLGEDRWVRDRLLPEINRAVREGHTIAYA